MTIVLVVHLIVLMDLVLQFVVEYIFLNKNFLLFHIAKLNVQLLVVIVLVVQVINLLMDEVLRLAEVFLNHPKPTKTEGCLYEQKLTFISHSKLQFSVHCVKKILQLC